MNTTEARHEEPTVEECLAELRELFPKWTYRAVEVVEGAPRPKYKVVAGPSYHSSQVQFWNGNTLTDCMIQVRKLKEQQQ